METFFALTEAYLNSKMTVMFQGFVFCCSFIAFDFIFLQKTSPFSFLMLFFFLYLDTVIAFHSSL